MSKAADIRCRSVSPVAMRDALLVHDKWGDGQGLIWANRRERETKQKTKKRNISVVKAYKPECVDKYPTS